MGTAGIPGQTRGSPAHGTEVNALSPIRIIINRAKRDQIQEDRFTQIEKENRRLLESMTGMLKNRRKLFGGQNNLFSRQTNNIIDASTMTSDEISKIFSQSVQATSPTGNGSPMQLQFKRSLNRDYRRRELQRITEENQAILQRLQVAQPQIQSKKIESDYIKKIPVLKNMCEHPYILGQNTKRSRYQTLTTDGGQFPFRSISLNHYSQVSVVQQWCHQSSLGSERQSIDGVMSGTGRLMSPSNIVTTPRNITMSMFARPSVPSTIRSPVNIDKRQADGLDQNRVVHFKKGKYINGGYFVVEISTSTSNLYIAAFDVESPASFLISIPFPKAQEIVELFQHNFDQMSDFLSFSKGRLVMLNPILVKRRLMQVQQQQAEALNVQSLSSSFEDPGQNQKRAQTSYVMADGVQNERDLANQRQQNQLKSALWSQATNRNRFDDKRHNQEHNDTIYSQEGSVVRSSVQYNPSPKIEVKDEEEEYRKSKESDEFHNGIMKVEKPQNMNEVEQQSPGTNSTIMAEQYENNLMNGSTQMQQISNHTTMEIDVELEKLRNQ